MKIAVGSHNSVKLKAVEMAFKAVWPDKEKNQGIGSTIRMITPKKMINMVKQGMELGNVNDILFGKSNSKQAEGHFGLMTNNAITRTEGYKDGVIAALSRFIHPEIF